MPAATIGSDFTDGRATDGRAADSEAADNEATVVVEAVGAPRQRRRPSPKGLRPQAPPDPDAEAEAG